MKVFPNDEYITVLLGSIENQRGWKMQKVQKVTWVRLGAIERTNDRWFEAWTLTFLDWFSSPPSSHTRSIAPTSAFSQHRLRTHQTKWNKSCSCAFPVNPQTPKQKKKPSLQPWNTWDCKTPSVSVSQLSGTSAKHSWDLPDLLPGSPLKEPLLLPLPPRLHL